MTPTSQELFDAAVLGITLHNKGKACVNLAGNCLVMSDDGASRCAISWSLTDAMPGRCQSPQWVALTTYSRTNPVAFVACRLRTAHDMTLHFMGYEAWRVHMANIALEFRLDDSTLWWVTDD